MALPLLPTSLVGSYPQPDWLIDRAKLSKMVPRVRMDDLWLVPRHGLEAKHDQGMLVSVREQERTGLGRITGGEEPRENHSNRFASGVVGLRLGYPGPRTYRSGKPI